MPTLDMLREPAADPRIHRLEERLGLERSEVPPSVLREWVEHAWSGYQHARVQAFVPILVEREVRARIGSVDADAHPPGLSLRAWAC